MPTSVSSLEKITALLQEIELEKRARDECHADWSASVSSAKASGPIAKENDEIIRNTYGPNQPTYADSISGGGVPKRDRELYGTFTGQGGEDENPSKLVKDFDIDPSKYVRKRAASVPDDELLQDIALLGNNLLYAITEDIKSASNQNNAQQIYTPTAQVADPPPPELDESAAAKNAGITPQEELGVATGVCIGLQKQAEYHADLVARYLYGNLATKLAQNADTDENNKHENTGQEDQAPPPPELVSETKEEEEEKGLKRDKKKDIDEPTEVEEPEVTKEDAAKALETMEGATEGVVEEGQEEGTEARTEGDQLTQDELMDLIASILPEMGGIPALAGAGPEGEKLASAVIDHIQKGRFRIPSLRDPRIKRACDFVKNYISDLFEKNKRR